MKREPRKRSAVYDIRAHRELAKAFPALAARLKPLLLTEIEIECPHGHKLKVIAQLIAAGRAVFCPECRLAFLPKLHPGVEVPDVFEPDLSPESAPLSLRRETGGPFRQGLRRIAEGTGMLLGAAGTSLFGRRSLARRVLARTGGLLTSSIVHAVVLLLVMILGVGVHVPRKKEYVPLESAITPEEAKQFLEEARQRDIFSKRHQNILPQEVPLPEAPQARPPEPEDEIDEEERVPVVGLPLPDPDLADLPREMLTPTSRGALNPIGLGDTGISGSLALRGDRGTRLKAARIGGGGPDTESAVEKALAWLYRNQNDDGSWSFGGKDKDGARRAYRPALTGFAVLAFLGAGYSHKGGHKYSERVRKALTWIMDHQASDGGFSGRTARCGYSQGVVTLALCEALAMGGGYSDVRDDFDRRLLASARKAVGFVTSSQNPYGGWDYSPRGGTNDTSITVWNCMALKSARIAGLRVDGKTFQGIVNWLNKAQSLAGEGSGREWAGGRFAYRGYGGRSPGYRGTLVTVMHPAGLMMRLMNGTDPKERACYGTANLLLTLIPEGGAQDRADEVRKAADEFIRKNYNPWETYSEEQKRRLRMQAEAAVAAFPRTVNEYVARYYGSRWNGLSPGQQASLRETARQAVENHPKTADEYVRRRYRRWETMDENERKRALRYARQVAEHQVYGGGFPRNIYFLYHSSLAMFQMGGDHWKTWNPQMKKALLESQLSGGDDDGAWDPGVPSGMCYCRGRTMATALGAMTLEVYYRYLRIYRN
ncbi:MAG: prenyltransferase/squalene oxidase repeat-containing protein [Planctomycetota bacterium]|jgi:hypothetical protein